MIRSADVRTELEARNWEARLNRERPQRREVAEWIASQINKGSVGSPRVVELACGAGFLAEVLKRRFPTIRYCGFDLNPHLLEFARQRLEEGPDERDGGSVNQFRCANLVTDDWTDHLVELGWAGSVDAVVSIQALHDLGELAQQTQVLKEAHGQLRQEGLLVYGDLLIDADAPHPSRYSKEEHESMLHGCGFIVSGASTAESVRHESDSKDYTFAVFGDLGAFACRK